MRIVRVLISAVLAVFMALASFTAGAKKVDALSLTPEYFRDTASVKDDALDTVAVISTQPGYIERRGLLRQVSYDEFLRIFVNKATGKRSFQVVFWQNYYSSGWHFYSSANYQAANGPASTPTVTIDRKVEGCISPVECSYTEQVGFDVDESLLRGIAAGYVPGHAAVWRFKIIARMGADFEDGLSNAEVVGALARLDEYIAAHPATHQGPSSVPAGGAPPKPFGILMAPVPPTAQNPKPGALIAAVTPGSPAQMIGLSVGDIVYELNGQPMESVPHLQALLGAMSPGSSLSLAIVRGGSPMTLTGPR